MSTSLQVSYKVSPATVTTNITVLREALKKELEQYDVVVTSDTVKSAKTLMADLNKLSSQINEARKDIVSSASEHINKASDELKSLMEMCAEGREKLATQVAAFDAERLILAVDAALAYINEQYAGRSVREPFRRVRPFEWKKLSAITDAGSLTAASKREIDTTIEACVQLQDRYDARVARLDSLSEIAGLKTPLSQDDVEHILMCQRDTDYDLEVNRIVKKALAREKTAENLAEQAAAAKAEPVAEAKNPEPAPAPKQTHDEKPPAAGKVKLSVACVFKTEVPQGTSHDAVETEIRRVLANAGIKTLHSVHITENA